MALAGLGHLLDPCRPGLSQEVCCKASKHSHGCILTYVFVLWRAARRCASLCPTTVNKTARAVCRTGIRSGTGPAPSTHCPVTVENWWIYERRTEGRNQRGRGQTEKTPSFEKLVTHTQCARRLRKKGYGTLQVLNGRCRGSRACTAAIGAC
jgi:hypothetical protein